MSSDWQGFGDTMKAARQERHAAWKAGNTAAILASNVPHRITNAGETILFREPGMPKVDFYPSTGRWRVPAAGLTRGGHAARFLEWYQQQRSAT